MKQIVRLSLLKKLFSAIFCNPFGIIKNLHEWWEKNFWKLLKKKKMHIWSLVTNMKFKDEDSLLDFIDKLIENENEEIQQIKNVLKDILINSQMKKKKLGNDWWTWEYSDIRNSFLIFHEMSHI